MCRDRPRTFHSKNLRRRPGRKRMYELTVKSEFSAAHALRGYEGNCANVHGHNWKVELAVQADMLTPTGLAVDFRELKSVLSETLANLDHKNLSEIPPFDQLSPSSENIAKWLFEQMAPAVERLGGRLAAVNVAENDDCSVSYDGIC